MIMVHGSTAVPPIIFPYFAAMKFSVAPNNGTAGSYGTSVDDGDFVHMTILSNGKVGIGTNYPSEKLDVNGGH